MNDKVVLITGAGSGVGRATAILLGREGAAVGAMGRTARTVEETARLVSEQGGKALAILGDVSREAEAEVAVAKTVAAFGRLDILVSNAAVQLHQQDRPIHEQGLDAWERGIMIPWGEPFVLVGSDGEVQEAAFRLKRIGYDAPTGFLKGGPDAWKQANLPVGYLKLVTPQDLYQQMQAGTAPDRVPRPSGQ